MKSIKQSLVLLVVALGFLAVSRTEASDPTSTSQNPSSVIREDVRADDDGGVSVAPVIGYDPTFGFVFGGAFFYKQDKFNLGTDFNLNFKQVYQLHLKVAHVFTDAWEYQLLSSNTKGYDPYFGEGGETNPNAAVKLWGVKSSQLLKLIYHPSDIFAVGVFGGVRIHTEEPDESGNFQRYFPDETSGAVGLSAEIDTRDNAQDPRNGFRFSFEPMYIPAGFSNLPNLQDAFQMEGSFIVYKEVLEKVFPDTIAAFRVMGGYTFGNPSYMYRYALGGANQMKGYLDNRFRGNKYYMQQTELRFPVYKALSAALMMGFADITDGEFTNPKLSYGVGIRIGLPPDYVSKIRIDFDYGRDQSTISANFGQTF